MNNSAKNIISVLSDYSLFDNTLYKIIPVIPISNVCYKFFNSVFDIFLIFCKILFKFVLTI